MTASSIYTELEKFVQAEKYDEAELLCREVLATDINSQFWLTQLGYVCFLNEKNIDAFYVHAPTVFTTLVTKYPTDVNAHFWRGYVYDIAYNNAEIAVTELRTALALEADHSFSCLALASLVEPEERVILLQRVLSRQPYNFRALRDLADVLLVMGKGNEARDVLVTIVNQQPYVEYKYGVMSEYVNAVLTNAIQAQAIQQAAQRQLKQLN